MEYRLVCAENNIKKDNLREACVYFTEDLKEEVISVYDTLDEAEEALSNYKTKVRDLGDKLYMVQEYHVIKVDEATPDVLLDDALHKVSSMQFELCVYGKDGEELIKEDMEEHDYQYALWEYERKRIQYRKRFGDKAKTICLTCNDVIIDSISV